MKSLQKLTFNHCLHVTDYFDEFPPLLSAGVCVCMCVCLCVCVFNFLCMCVRTGSRYLTSGGRCDINRSLLDASHHGSVASSYNEKERYREHDDVASSVNSVASRLSHASSRGSDFEGLCAPLDSIAEKMKKINNRFKNHNDCTGEYETYDNSGSG